MKDQTLMLMKYNQEDNNEVIRILGSLSEEERLADRKAYFRSLQGIFEHAVLAGVFFQKMLLPELPQLKEVMSSYLETKYEYKELNFRNFSELKSIAQNIDKSFVDLVSHLSEEELNKSITVRTPRGESIMQVWVILYQYITHSVHHKGQIMQILEEMGVEANFGMLRPKYD